MQPLCALSVGWLQGSADDEQQRHQNDMRPRDVFLGGSCSHTRWRDDIAIPLLL
jgi:hypothetical protein